MSNAELQARLEQLCRAVPAAHVGVSLKVLRGSDCQLGVQGERDFPAASVIKVPILMELYRQASMGWVSLDKKLALKESDKVGGAGVLLELHEGVELSLEDLARLMIVVSDNTASNLLLDRVKPANVNELMSHLGMTGSQLGRRFMEGPTPGHDNRMTPDDAVRCLEGIWKRELLGEATDKALGVLRRQQYREKIPLLLPHGTVVGNKTGELDGVRHDAALIELEHCTYALSCFTEGTLDGSPDFAKPWLVDRAIAEISLCVYQELLARPQDGKSEPAAKPA